MTFAGEPTRPRTCSDCGDVRLVVDGGKRSPITRRCRSCASKRVRKWEFTPEARERGLEAYRANLRQVDPYVVDLLVMGVPERATVPERIAAIRRMPGRSAASLARQLGVTERSIQRYRARMREMAA